jgi:hypothetical protein
MQPLASSPPTAEWIKILASTSAGFLFAMLGEPLKVALNDWYKRRNLRLAVYRELADNLAPYLDYGGKEWLGTRPSLEFVISRRVYDYALGQPELAFRIRDFGYLESAYRLLIAIETNTDPEWSSQTAFDMLLTAIGQGRLDRRILLKSLRSPWSKYLLNEQLKPFEGGPRVYRGGIMASLRRTIGLPQYSDE